MNGIRVSKDEKHAGASSRIGFSPKLHHAPNYSSLSRQDLHLMLLRDQHLLDAKLMNKWGPAECFGQSEQEEEPPDRGKQVQISVPLNVGAKKSGGRRKRNARKVKGAQIGKVNVVK